MINGRNAIDPICMFKYLLLKAIFELSDVDIVERSKYDLSFKYFLGMAPEICKIARENCEKPFIRWMSRSNPKCQ